MQFFNNYKIMSFSLFAAVILNDVFHLQPVRVYLSCLLGLLDMMIEVFDS